MSVRTSQRITAVAAPLVVAGLVLSACGSGDSDAESRATIELTAGETSFETLAPATTPAPTDDDTAGEEDASSTVQEYIIQSGDFPLGVAEKFGVSLEDLANLNGWAVCGTTCPEFPFPGNPIRVPGSASATTETASTDDGTGGTETPAEEGETGEAIPEPAGDTCAEGSYTIEEGDFEGRVADKFDITVEELRAANSSTADYNVFYVGLVIVIPERDNCG